MRLLRRNATHREHVFPRCLTTTLPAQERWRGQDTAVIILDGSKPSATSSAHREMREQFNVVTVSRVCRSCNQGWMNDLETAARPVLTPLIDGQVAEVDGNVVQDLATWVVKTCLMAELTHPESAATPPEFYRWLFETRTPPPHTRIWAVPIKGQEWSLRVKHVGILYGDAATTDVSQPYNVHSTTIGLGRVAFCVMGAISSELEFPPLEDIPPLQAVRLWPDPRSFDWERHDPLDDRSAWLLSDIMRLWFQDDDEFFIRLIDLQLRQ